METEMPLNLLRQIEVQAEAGEGLPDWVRESAEMQTLQYLGLCRLPEERPPKLTQAGRQYIERAGKVSMGVLQYLPHYIDSLTGREALIEAGARIAERYGRAVAEGKTEEYTRQILPKAFAPAVSPELAARMYAATIASITRLMDQEPAGCVAEEIAATRVLEEAAKIIKGQEKRGTIGGEEAEQATESLTGVFALFGDSEVLGLFEMEEPSDAAILSAQAEESHGEQIDQRLEAWFVPLWGKAASGHLGELSEWEKPPGSGG